MDYYKYLGVYMDANLKMNITIQKFAESGSRSLGTIISKYKLMPSMCFQTYTKLFNACVSPVLDYCSPVWSHRNCNELEEVQHRAMRIYLGVNKFSAKCAVIGDMGWTPGDIRRKLNLLRYWNRLVLLPNTRITKIIFLESFNSEEKASICLHIREVLKEINFENLYHLLNVCDLTAAESKLISKYEAKWKDEIHCKPKLRFYKQFKHNFGTEHYLLHNSLNIKQRSYLSQLRIGILQINIEIGRYRSIPLEERLCRLCNMNEIEDEIHFLFRCPTYNVQRNIWFTTMQRDLEELNDDNSINDILKDMFHHDKSTANYIINCMELRKIKTTKM